MCIRDSNRSLGKIFRGMEKKFKIWGYSEGYLRIDRE